jgi:hypothetical protein
MVRILRAHAERVPRPRAAVALVKNVANLFML